MMRRFFYRRFSFVLILALLFSLTSVAEDSIAVGDNAEQADTVVTGEIVPIVNDAGNSSDNELEGIQGVELPLNEDDLLTLGDEDIPIEITDVDMVGEIMLGEDESEEVSEIGGIGAENTEDSEPVEAANPTVPKTLILGKGETYALNIKKGTFASSSKAVATVSSKGVITAKKTGTTKITVKSGKKTVGTCKVTVLNAPGKVTIKPTKLTVPQGGTVALKVTLPKKTASNKLTWTSSNKKIATVDKNGVVKGVKVGSAKITVTTFNKKKATCTVTVNKDPASVEFSSKSISIGLGESVTVKPVVNKGAKPKYTWSSKNKKVASVDKKGKITGVKTGTTTITVTTQNKLKATLTVKVLKKPTKVTLAKNMSVKVGGTVQLNAKLNPSKSASYKMTWKSSNDKIAKVDGNGVVTGVKAGKANITVTTFNKLSATCEVVVGDFVIVNGVVTGYTGQGGEIVIPSVDGNGKKITAIGKEAFKNNTTITKVSISSGITVIGVSAFEGCKMLKSVELPNSLTVIDNAAFKDCGELIFITSFD